MSKAKITRYLQMYFLDLYNSVENYKHKKLYDFEIMP